MSGESRSERAQRGIQFLDAQAARSRGDRKKRVYAAMHVQGEDRVLDVGCGPGTDTLPLAQIVGPTGCVVGLDIQEEMTAEANERAREAGVEGWVEHCSHSGWDLTR